jgi:DNA-binding MarR family transcriptional regulator
MNPVATIKRFILRFLKAAATSQPQALIDDAIRQQMGQAILQSDINDARRELEREGLIAGEPDRFDKTEFTWSITNEGRHAAKNL